MSLLFFKLTATPLIIALAGWLSGRWGAAAGGWLSGLPLTTGPVSIFLALEYGLDFAAQSALGTLLAMPAIAAFGIAYVAGARRGAGWVAAGITAQLAYFAVLTLTISISVSVPVWLVFCLGGISLALGLSAVGLRDRPVLRSLSSRSVLFLRMVVATALVLVITLAAPHLGPLLSGMVSTVLVVAGVLAAAGHREHGATGGIAVIRGMMMGQISFLGFLTVVWAVLPVLGFVAYGIAIAVALVLGVSATRLVALLFPARATPPRQAA